jgi:hypothetical protein
MMGPIPGKPADAAQFTPFRPATVLYELDTPRTFTFIPADGKLYLAHWFDESESANRAVLRKGERTLKAMFGSLPLGRKAIEVYGRAGLELRDTTSASQRYILESNFQRLQTHLGQPR